MGLEDRIADGSAVLGVIGLGYVGLPLAVEMAESGSRVIGVDIDAGRSERWGRGKGSSTSPSSRRRTSSASACRVRWTI